MALTKIYTEKHLGFGSISLLIPAISEADIPGIWADPKLQAIRHRQYPGTQNWVNPTVHCYPIGSSCHN